MSIYPSRGSVIGMQRCTKILHVAWGRRLKEPQRLEANGDGSMDPLAQRWSFTILSLDIQSSSWGLVFRYSLGVQIPFQQAFGCPGFSDKWIFLELFNGELIVRSMPIPWGSYGLRWKFDVTVLETGETKKQPPFADVFNWNQGQILVGTVERRDFLKVTQEMLPFAATKGSWKLLFI